MNAVSGNDDPVLTGQVAVPEQPPVCPDHVEVQHRDGKPPWCNRCGWQHRVSGRPARNWKDQP